VAAQSLEKQIASMGETVERRLKENFEAWSKAQLEIIQQQAGKFSSDLLTQARAEAESIAEQVQTRLKSDAQTLETRTVEAMHGRLGKIADEFRSILERAFA
jgi:vacuolar-type H+-ATPase subunit H